MQSVPSMERVLFLEKKQIKAVDVDFFVAQSLLLVRDFALRKAIL